MSSSSTNTPLRRSARIQKLESSKPTVVTSTSADALSEMFEQMTLKTPKPKEKKKPVSRSKTTFSDAIEKIRSEIKQSRCEEVYTSIFSPKQTQLKPIAVIVAGPAGAGKSTVYKYVLPSWFLNDAQYTNVDNYVEYYMEKYNMFSNPSEKRQPNTYSPEELRSLNMSALIKGAQCTERDLQEWISEKRHLIIDKPCDEARIARSLVKKLEDNGYDVYMLVVFVSKTTALNRNNPYREQKAEPSSSRTHRGRERQLPDAVIEKLWTGVNNNIQNKIYEDIFKKYPDRLLIVNNDAPSTLTQPSTEVMYAKTIWTTIFPTKYRLRSPRSRRQSSQSGGIRKHKK